MELTHKGESSLTTSASATSLIRSETATSTAEETLVGSTIVLEHSQFDNELLFDVAQEMFHEHCHCSHKVQEQLPLAHAVYCNVLACIFFLHFTLGYRGTHFSRSKKP